MPIPPINSYDRVAKFLTSKPMQTIIRNADRNPALFQSGTIFVMASIVRPVTIGLTPAKNDEMKQDRLYSACKSIASGVTDLGFSSLLFIPANKAINKFSENLAKNKKSLIYNDAKATKMYKTLLNRGLKIAVVPIIAFFNFRYLKNIANILTGHKNENK